MHEVIRRGAFTTALLVCALAACERPETREGALIGATNTPLAASAHDQCEQRRGRAPHIIETISNQGGSQEGWAINFEKDGDAVQANWSGRARHLNDRNPHHYNLNVDMEFLLVRRGALVRHHQDDAGREEVQFAVNFDYDFALSRNPVSVGAWRQCEQSCLCNIRAREEQGAEQPILGVSWEDARIFLFWVAINDPQAAPFRLPSESEWLFAHSVFPDLFEEGGLEWLGDCSFRPLADIPRDGRALQRMPHCQTKLLIRRDVEAMERSPVRGGRERWARTSPNPEAGFRMVREFDLSLFEAREVKDEP